MTGIDVPLPRGWSVPFATIAAVLSGGSVAAAATVAYRDPSSPFRVLASLGEWRVPGGAGNRDPRLRVTIARGTLHDEDRGALDLTGLEIAIDGSDSESFEVLNPGPLSELQQAGVVDAVASHLGARGIRYVAAVLKALDAPATVSGVLGSVSPADGQPLAAFGASRAACEAAGAIAALSALGAAYAVARLTTIPSGDLLAMHVHSVSIDDAVYVVGRLD